MFPQRPRILSDHIPEQELKARNKEMTPPSPVITNLELDCTGIEELEIPPSNEFDTNKEEIHSFFSTTIAISKDVRPKARILRRSEFNIQFKLKPSLRARSKSCHEKSLNIFEALYRKNSNWNLSNTAFTRRGEAKHFSNAYLQLILLHLICSKMILFFIYI